jgi:hypothetical protein
MDAAFRIPDHLGFADCAGEFCDHFEVYRDLRRVSRFSLLWGRDRDGLEFQGHANTVTMVLDMDGNIFTGFTLVE